MSKKSRDRREFVAVVVFALCLSFLNSLHVIIQWLRNPPSHIFTGIAHYFADYFLYVAQMAQGAAGSWIFAQHPFTNEPMAPTWIHWFNVTLGHLGGIVGLSPFATYNLSLFILVFSLLLLWYVVSFLLFPTQRLARLTCFLFLTTASSFFRVGQFWFSPGLAFDRLGGVPHQVWQTILFVSLCIVFSKAKIHFFLRTSLVSILAFAAATTNPVQILLFILAAAITVAIRGFRWKYVAPFTLVILFGGLGALMTRLEFSRQAVWVASLTWELAQRTANTLPTLLLTIGPIVFFVPFGIPEFLKKASVLHLLLFFYGMLSFLFFLSPIPKFLGVSPVRFLHPAPYAIIAILATHGFFHASDMVYRAVRKKVSVNAVHLSLFTLYLFLTLPVLYQHIVNRVTPSTNPLLLLDTLYNHVPRPIGDALIWLRSQPVDIHQPIVLTDPHIPVEVLVPVFTAKISFSGHPLHTLYPDVKEALRQQFFTGLMPHPQKFLSDHRIGYIIAASNRELPPLVASLLTPIYKNTTVTIYTYAFK